MWLMKISWVTFLLVMHNPKITFLVLFILTFSFPCWIRWRNFNFVGTYHCIYETCCFLNLESYSKMGGDLNQVESNEFSKFKNNGELWNKLI